MFAAGLPSIKRQSSKILSLCFLEARWDLTAPGLLVYSIYVIIS